MNMMMLRTFTATGALVAALLAAPPAATANPESLVAADRSHPASVRIASTVAPPSDVEASHAAQRSGPSWFFGFLEFDWDPRAPGGVPGFSPWPSDKSNTR